jgi:S1-C subfamily serine protease
MRAQRGLGVEILGVEPGSVAARAGVRPGDLITTIGGIAAPTPAQVNTLLAGPAAGVVLAAITRGHEHLVVVMMK